ncbi:hypothetical protein SDC9_99224 [bioreactor metagenome]|uniref:Uncharacterized protein n=1 Tax=bioreactor metagenome TaxID=1076179 RepID=A0A645AGZ9_9ZZZZ
MTDRIRLTVKGDAELLAALAAHEEYIKAEVLATGWVLEVASAAGDVDLNGHMATVTLVRV